MSVLIFGILNIGFALLKLGAPLFSLAMSKIKMPGNSAVSAMTSDPAFVALTKFNLWVGVVLGLALLAFGIGLLLLQNWARLGSIVYSIIDIVLVVVVSMVTWPFTKRMMEQMPNVSPGMVAGFAMIGMALGIILGLAYPVLLLFFMTRPNVIEACQPEQPVAPAG
jgi:hypothetical protein